tara:strand:- start:375 stop:956 length:582 start_codon:yes stop_codon:yes gene_type:complete
LPPHFEIDHSEIYSSRGPQWNHKHLQRRLHFINCNGSKDPQKSTSFFCDPETEIPVFEAEKINGNILEGTVVGVTCCYGACLKKHDQDIKDHMSICNIYLGNSAYGYFGSSTTACVNDLVKPDTIVRMFLLYVLRGESLGNAVLMARQEFIKEELKNTGSLSASAQRVLVQFNLMGYSPIRTVGYLPFLRSKL